MSKPFIPYVRRLFPANSQSGRTLYQSSTRLVLGFVEWRHPRLIPIWSVRHPYPAGRFTFVQLYPFLVMVCQAEAGQ